MHVSLQLNPVTSLILFCSWIFCSLFWSDNYVHAFIVFLWIFFALHFSLNLYCNFWNKSKQLLMSPEYNQIDNSGFCLFFKLFFPVIGLIRLVWICVIVCRQLIVDYSLSGAEDSLFTKELVYGGLGLTYYT